jgi:hypothetical protein
MHVETANNGEIKINIDGGLIIDVNPVRMYKQGISEFAQSILDDMIEN